ncbi:MAG: hypothetical protein SGI74_02055 [Oligoflexia bacterium]|nr:hypothetical protein [Oligoflexia bacterium]
MPHIEPGFNSDIVCAGTKYHVQTEDWGEENPFVVTRVYHSGTVVLSLKTTYEKIAATNFAVGRQAVRLGMREQHQQILDQLVSGTLINASLK